MLFVLDVQLAALQVDIATIFHVVFMDLCMNHFLALLIDLVLLNALVDLLDLVTNFTLVLLLGQFLNIRLRGVQDLTRFGLARLLIT